MFREIFNTQKILLHPQQFYQNGNISETLLYIDQLTWLPNTPQTLDETLILIPC